jgi:hypothetical protein
VVSIVRQFTAKVETTTPRGEQRIARAKTEGAGDSMDRIRL